MEVEIGHSIAYMDQSSIIIIGRKWYQENFKKFVSHKAQQIETSPKFKLLSNEAITISHVHDIFSCI